MLTHTQIQYAEEYIKQYETRITEINTQLKALTKPGSIPGASMLIRELTSELHVIVARINIMEKIIKGEYPSNLEDYIENTLNKELIEAQVHQAKVQDAYDKGELEYGDNTAELAYLNLRIKRDEVAILDKLRSI